MNNLLLAGLGIILFVFCVIDLWHLKEMLKTLKRIEIVLLGTYIKKDSWTRIQ